MIDTGDGIVVNGGYLNSVEYDGGRSTVNAAMEKGAGGID